MITACIQYLTFYCITCLKKKLAQERYTNISTLSILSLEIFREYEPLQMIYSFSFPQNYLLLIYLEAGGLFASPRFGGSFHVCVKNMFRRLKRSWLHCCSPCSVMHAKGCFMGKHARNDFPERGRLGHHPGAVNTPLALKEDISQICGVKYDA